MKEEIEDILETGDDLLLGRDVRAAMLRDRHTPVDTEAAWADFMESVTTEEETAQPMIQPATPRRANWVMLGVALGVAASVACFLLLRPLMLPTAQQPNVLMVSQAVDQGLTDVEITSSAQGQKSVSAVQSATYRKADGVIDYRQAREQLAASDIQTVSTPRGKVQTVILPDGTRVLLNNESRLRFPARFSGDTRTVQLEGEAYFTVAKDAAHPFIVKSHNLATTALGTQFNVKAYQRAAIHITLVDGSIRVTDEEQQQEVLLCPGEDVSVVDNKLVIVNSDTKVYHQWEEGFFYYDNVPLVDILVELGRWYNTNIELEDRELMSYRLHFIADRNAPVSEAMELLNQFSYLSVSQDGNVIRIKKKK